MFSHRLCFFWIFVLSGIQLPTVFPASVPNHIRKNSPNAPVPNTDSLTRPNCRGSSKCNEDHPVHSNQPRKDYTHLAAGIVIAILVGITALTCLTAMCIVHRRFPNTRLSKEEWRRRTTENRPGRNKRYAPAVEESQV